MMLGSSPIVLEHRHLSVNEALAMSRTKAADHIFDYFGKNKFVRRFPLFPDAADGPQVKVTGNFRLFKEMVSVEVLWTDWVIEGRLDDNSFNDFSSRLTLTQKLSSVDKQGQTCTTTPRGLSVKGEKLCGVKCWKLGNVTVEGTVGTYEERLWEDTADTKGARLSIREPWSFQLGGLQLLRAATRGMFGALSQNTPGSSGVVTIDLLDKKMYSNSNSEPSKLLGHVYTSPKDVPNPLAQTAAAATAAGVGTCLRDINSNFWKTHNMFKSLPELLEFWYRYKPHEVAQKWQAHFQGVGEGAAGAECRNCMTIFPKANSSEEENTDVQGAYTDYRGSRLMSAADCLRQLQGQDEAIPTEASSAGDVALLEQNGDLRTVLSKLTPYALVAVHGRGNDLRFDALPRDGGVTAQARKLLGPLRGFLASEYKVFAISMKSQVSTSSMKEEDFLESSETVDDDVLLRWASSQLVVPKVKLRVSVNTIWRERDSREQSPCCPAETKWCFCTVVASLLLFALPLIALYCFAFFDGKSGVDVMWQSSIPVITATRQGGSFEMQGKVVYSVTNEGLLPLCVSEVVANLFYVRSCKKKVCLRRRIALGEYDIRVSGESSGLVDPSGSCLDRGDVKQFDIDVHIKSSLDKPGVEDFFKDCYADSMLSLNFDGEVRMDWKWSSVLMYMPLDNAKISHSEVVPCIPSVSLVEDSDSFMKRNEEAEEKLVAEPTPEELAYLVANKARHDIALVEEMRKIKALAVQDAADAQLVLNSPKKSRLDLRLTGRR